MTYGANVESAFRKRGEAGQDGSVHIPLFLQFFEQHRRIDLVISHLYV
jgi:hypothetical protein